MLFSIRAGAVSGDRCGFAITSVIDLAGLFDYGCLHRQDFQLLADLFVDGVFSAVTVAGRFTRGEFVDDLAQSVVAVVSRDNLSA